MTLHKTGVALATLLLALGGMVDVHADALTITYFTLASNDPDANHLAGGVYTNEVQNGLGTNGLPLLNIPLFGCTTNCYAVSGAPGFPNGGNTPNVNVDSQGEITYWDPTLNPYVTQTLQTTTTLPFDVPQNFFPPNGTGTQGDGGDAGYQAAELTGTLDAASTEQLMFEIGSDDMAFAYIDGSLVCSDGGVHGSASVLCTTPTIGAGDHTFDLFFVDINQVQAGLSFSIATQGVTTIADIPNSGSIPEPATLALVGTALVGLRVARRKASS